MPSPRVEIVPVIDLLGGQVVRGVGGDRKKYAPVKSRIAPDASPKSVARAIADKFSPTKVYVADLDAINGAEPDWNSLDQIAESGMGVWLDCGIDSVPTAATVQRKADVRPCFDSFVVGLESIRSVKDLSAICAALKSEKTMFSLDLKQGRPLTQARDLANLSPLEIAKHARHAGFARIVVLDLTFVGMNRGVGVANLCRQLRSLFPELEIVAGGGIRTTADIQLLADAGCNDVLVASALHNGSIAPGDLDSFRA